MPSNPVGDPGIVVISFSPRARARQVMQKAFIKETYYCTILNRAPTKLAPVSMAQLSTRGSLDPGETARRCDWTWKCWVWVYRAISHADKLMVQTHSNCLYMENRDKHTPRLREPRQNMKAGDMRKIVNHESSTTKIDSHYFVLHYILKRLEWITQYAAVI